jgi:hypothetical protein
VATKEATMYEDYSVRECYACEEKRESLVETKYWLEYLLEQVYSEGLLDVVEFERTLQELSAIVGLKVPTSSPNLERKADKEPSVKSPKFDVLGWIRFNNQYLKNIST